MRAKGIEPIRLSAPDPKSGLSTNFNTPARNIKGKIFRLFLGSSGGGNRTARPSGYEPDELPTALPRDIGLQIYGHFLKVQIFIAFFSKKLAFCFFYADISYAMKAIIPSKSSFAKDFCSPVERFLRLMTPASTSFPPTIERNGISFLSA